MKKTTTIAISLSALALAACTPPMLTEVNQSRASELHLGLSSIADVKDRLSGGRLYEDDTEINGKQIHYLNYIHVKASLLDEPRARYQSYLFYNDKLVGIEKSSRFDEDSTDFNVEKAKEIKNGMTRQQVIGLLGKPSGEFIYPISKNPGDSGIAYYNVRSRQIPVIGRMQTNHEARVSLNNNNEVDDVFVDDKTVHGSFAVFNSFGER